MVLLKKSFIITKRFITLAFIICGLVGCSSFLYYPKNELIFQYQGLGFPYQDIFFKSQNGMKLHAVHFQNKKREKSKALILFFHGNGENLSSHFATLAWVLDYSYDYLIFDYQGYGISEGSPSPEKTVQDGKAAIELASQLAEGRPLVIYAQSLGGAVALRSLIELREDLQRKYNIQIIIIDSSFLSYQDAARGVLSHHWLTWAFQPLPYVVLSDQWAPRELVASLPPIPFVVIHGKKDQIIEFDLGEKLYAAIPHSKKEFWIIEDGSHTDALWRHGGTFRRRFLQKLEQAIR